MADDDSPVVIQRRLRAEIRRLREAARLTQKDVAAQLEWSPSKIIRIESGATNIGMTDLRALLMSYGVTDEARVQQLMQMARASRKRTWRDAYRPHIDAQFYAFLGYESSAVRIRQLQSTFVPGLLQTQDYTRSLAEASLDDAKRLERGMNIRDERQRIIDDQDGPDMVFLLDEAVLRRQVGSRDLMREQLTKILALSNRSDITIQVIPFGSGTYRGMGGSFVVFDLSLDYDDRVVFVEEFLHDQMIHDDHDEIVMYAEIFSEAAGHALPPEETRIFLQRLLSGAR